jgi:predicted dienelactone hydrolase
VRRGLLLLLLFFAVVTPARAAEENDYVLARRNVVIWDNGGTEKKPLLIFSHGFHGCATQSRYLTDAWAEAGYLVIAINHADATCHGGTSHLFERATVPFRKIAAWDDKIYEDRAEDIRQVLDALRHHPGYRTQILWDQVGLIGHSLGGYTVLGLAGAWPRWTLSGIRAVLVFSPFALPFVQQDTLKTIKVPVMFQGGTRDFPLSPAMAEKNGVFDKAAPIKFLVVFRGATHFAWTDLFPAAQEGIKLYSLAFLDRFVRGKPQSPLLTHAFGDVRLLRWDGCGKAACQGEAEN